jgi:glycine dehydrogenase subunit 1
MGPQGMQDIGKIIMQRSMYASKRLSEIKGVKTPYFTAPFFKEFVVNFDNIGLTVEQINKKLLKKAIFGGKDLSREFPELGQSALYCFTEIHTKGDIDILADTLKDYFAE